ncbi:carbohydrate ABC transporter permease [Serinicoccus kebangsaanensis]|uniref:carbohydrate ABC transporter permease n=1 Tax=Serinicoccus kebangsaanensis TaxID=2602069 RepID=UPI00124DCABC|nr:sugar ABC transporter permease [Serinicoccus kebangsaanensis]
MTARAREALAGYAFAAPTLLLLGVFVLLPLGGAMVISLQETNGFGEGTFVGLDNYGRLVQDPVFWRATLNTALYTVLVTPAAMAIGLGLALLLDSALPARGALRSVLILPMAISGVATALMGVLIFDENSGFLTEVARAMGLPQVDWQTHGPAAFASVVIMTLWWRVGFNMLIYLAGLQGVAHELYEAARLDGANAWQRLRHVTVPQLSPQSFFLVILNIIYSFQVFDIVFVMTGGGPERATTVLVTYAYDTGFVTRDQGYAAAIGVVLLAVTLVVTALRWRAQRRREESV